MFPAPKLRELISVPLLGLQLLLLILVPLQLRNSMAALPARVPVHFNWQGQPDRYGSPGELWISVGMMAFLALTLHSIIVGFAHERWLVPEHGTARHAHLLRERRVILARLMQWMSLAASMLAGGMGLSIARAMAAGAAPTPGKLLIPVPVFFGLILIALIVTGLRLRRVRHELEAMGGSFTHGMHADGWIWGGLLYYAPNDPELIVPKRGGFGQTFNFARPSAWIITGMAVLPAIIVLLSLWAR